jgi:hypothetical protein
MRRLILTIKTGEESIGTFLAWRDVEDEYLKQEYRTISKLPNVVGITVVQKSGESWSEYLSLLRTLEVS